MSAQPGSIFAVLSRLVRFGLGGTNGNGTQRVSWMHAEDYVRAVELLLDDERWDGVVNLSAPEAPTNRDLMRTLRRAWHVPFGSPAPEWLIQVGTFLLQTEPELVLKSRWVKPARLEQAGFVFRFPDWQSAAADLVQRMRNG